MLHLFGTTCRCLSLQPVQLLPLRTIWRHISLTWPIPHSYRHSPWPVDVTELFSRFCCWTLIRLSCHWAWLRHFTIEVWLIDWFFDAYFYSYETSINQISIASPKPGSVARELNWCSAAKSMKQFRNINRLLCVPVSMRERPSLRDVFSDVSWR